MHLCIFGHFSRGQLFATPWTVVHQAPLSMGFPRQEYWSGLLYPPPEYLPDSGIKPASPAAPELQADSKPLSQQGSTSNLVLSLNRWENWDPGKHFTSKEKQKYNKNVYVKWWSDIKLYYFILFKYIMIFGGILWH